MMSEVGVALDRWLALKTKHGGAVSTHAGATDNELAQAQGILGFEFCQEARELFRHSNGVESTQTLLPEGHYFESLSKVELRLTWRDSLLNDFPDYEDGRYESLPGAPSKPLLLFAGGHGIGIECGPIGTGAVIHLDSDLGFFWIARSLTEYLNRLCDYDSAGLIEWREDVPMLSSYPNGIARELHHQNSSQHWGVWRWE